MKKHITVENNLYDSYLVIDLDKTNDEILPVYRKTGGGADKNQFFIQGRYFDVFKSFFPSIYKDREDQITGRNKMRIKNYFNISSLLNGVDFVNKEIIDEYNGNGIINKDEYFNGLNVLSESQNLNTSFYIESEIANAQNGIGFKNWDDNFKKFIKIILLPTTQLKVYLFKESEVVSAYWEFKQDFIEGMRSITIENTSTVGRNTIFFGSPGTGKSHKVEQVLKDLDTKFYERVTFHPEYDHATFVGGYKPVSEKDEKGNDIIKYKFVPQAFTNIYERSWIDPNNQYYLVVEEINRGNCAEIFGDIFQLLDRNSNYTVSPSEELKNHLIEKFGNDKNHDGIANGLKLPPNLTIYATMNTSDQSLFPMDSAFKRRWEWEYVPINYEKFNEDKKENKSFYFQIDTENGSIYSWNDFIKKINNSHIKENQSLGMDKCIGNYFINPEIDNKISLKQFINKVIFYLWNDVFKDEENKVFEAKTSYEDFFPIETNGKTKIIELFQRIGLEPINLKKDADLIDENSLTENNEG